MDVSDPVEHNVLVAYFYNISFIDFSS